MARQYNQHAALLSAWKRCFSRSPIRREVLKEAKCPRKRGPRGGARYRCADCKKDYGSSDIQVDHKDPVIPLNISAVDLSWDVIAVRLFCDKSNLQALCSTCHKKKNAIEREERKKHR